MGVNKTTCFVLSGLHQVAKFYGSKYCLCVADFEFSASDQKIMYEIKTACEQVRRWACVGVWYRGRGSSAVGCVVVGVVGGYRMAN